MAALSGSLMHPNRRQWLLGSGCLAGAALSQMLASEQATAATGTGSHHRPRARSIIYLHMIGAPSHLDLFDEKPQLKRWHGKSCPEQWLKGRRFAFIGGDLKLAASSFRFSQHGKSGHNFSEILPHLASVADELCVLKGMHTNEINHAPAQLFLHTGFGQGGRPSLGSWLAYGLGQSNRDLPNYMVLLSGPAGGAGTALWSTGFLPSHHQGVPLSSDGDPVLYLSNPKGESRTMRREVLDSTAALNAERFRLLADPEIRTRIEQYEMAFRMQASVPELMDVRAESPRTLAMYGATPGKPSFANNCLLARRLIERGVRMVQLFDSDWDHHGNLNNRLRAKAADVDQACAALIADLKQRGLLEDTLVVWGSEFGRTPLQQGIDADGRSSAAGRDHHKDAFALWLAGGGIRPGISHGSSDELGFGVTQGAVHVHDLNATLLHLLGLDHERLTFRHQGRDYRLTDVHGQIVAPILS